MGHGQHGSLGGKLFWTRTPAGLWPDGYHCSHQRKELRRLNIVCLVDGSLNVARL